MKIADVKTWAAANPPRGATPEPLRAEQAAANAGTTGGGRGSGSRRKAFGAGRRAAIALWQLRAGAARRWRSRFAGAADALAFPNRTRGAGRSP